MNESEQYVRKVIEACADCGAPEAPYAYLQDGRHYCVRCARVKLIRDKIRPAGKREDDLTLDDVLFRELPLGDGFPGADGPANADGPDNGPAMADGPVDGPESLDSTDGTAGPTSTNGVVSIDGGDIAESVNGAAGPESHEVSDEAESLEGSGSSESLEGSGAGESAEKFSGLRLVPDPDDSLD